MLSKCEQSAPGSEDFTSLYTSSAQDAAFAVCALLEFLLDGDTARIAGVPRFSTESQPEQPHAGALSCVLEVARRAITRMREGRTFAACLPEGQYQVSLAGPYLSSLATVDVPSSSMLRIKATASTEIRKPPTSVARIHGDLDGLLQDITAANPRVIGLGEATHGTAEFVSARGALAFELIRHAGVRLLLFEFDAIQSAPVDDYVNGADVDIDRDDVVSEVLLPPGECDATVTSYCTWVEGLRSSAG